ncbi:hypothetical protein P7C70_g7414, partial [Phenoliferia sp. Uapishka_3]
MSTSATPPSRRRDAWKLRLQRVIRPASPTSPSNTPPLPSSAASQPISSPQPTASSAAPGPIPSTAVPAAPTPTATTSPAISKLVIVQGASSSTAPSTLPPSSLGASSSAIAPTSQSLDSQAAAESLVRALKEEPSNVNRMLKPLVACLELTDAYADQIGQLVDGVASGLPPGLPLAIKAVLYLATRVSAGEDIKAKVRALAERLCDAYSKLYSLPNHPRDGLDEVLDGAVEGLKQLEQDNKLSTRSSFRQGLSSGEVIDKLNAFEKALSDGLIQHTALTVTKVDIGVAQISVDVNEGFTRMETLFKNNSPNSGQPANTIALSMNPTAPNLFGRDESRDRILQILAANDHVAIAGVGGLGKSTLSLSILHNPNIEARFGTRRHFIRCDQVNTSIRLQEEILLSVRGRPFNSTEDGHLLLALTGVLYGSPLFLILDNFEDPYNSTDQSAVVSFLEILVEISTLTFIITTRNATVANLTSPGGRSIRLLELTTLTVEDSAKLFNTKSDFKYSNDPLLPKLLRLLDGHPLTITLTAANSRQAPSLNSMINKWEEWSATGLTYGPATRHGNLKFALDLSFNSKEIRKTKYAIDLLSVLAILPSGLSLEAVHAVGDPKMPIAVQAVLATSLAYITEYQDYLSGDPVTKYLRTLVPVSTYLRNRLSAPDPRFVRRIATTLFKAIGSGEWTIPDEGYRFRSDIRPRILTLKILADHAGQQPPNVAGDEFEIARGLALACLIEHGYEGLQVQFVLEPMRAARRQTMEKARKRAMGFLDQDLREQISIDQVSLDRTLMAMDLARGYGCTDEAYWTPERHQEAEAWEEWFEAVMLDLLANFCLPLGRSADEDIFRLGRHAIRMGLMPGSVGGWKSGREEYDETERPESAEKEWRDLMEVEEREFERLASEREGQQAAV